MVKLRDSQHTLPECPSTNTETWLILAGKITTSSHKPWILVSGIFTPCSGPRSGLAGLNLPHLPYLFTGKPFCNLLCDLRVLESKHKWFKEVTILCFFKTLWHFSSKNYQIPTLLFNICQCYYWNGSVALASCDTTPSRLFLKYTLDIFSECFCPFALLLGLLMQQNDC